VQHDKSKTPMLVKESGFGAKAPPGLPSPEAEYRLLLESGVHFTHADTSLGHRHGANSPLTANGPVKKKKTPSIEPNRFVSVQSFNIPMPKQSRDHGQVLAAQVQNAASHPNSHPVKGKYILELFGGTGRLTQSCASRKLRTLPTFEVHAGIEFDLTRRSTQEAVLSLIRGGYVWFIHMGTPCTVFSRARHGIRDHVRARARESVGVELAMFCAVVARLMSSMNLFWSIENPATSLLWEFMPIVQLLELPNVVRVEWDMCAYGTPYKKATALLTNLQQLQQLSSRCTKDHVHVQLVGTERVKQGSKWVN
jgi:hypothetical protein